MSSFDHDRSFFLDQPQPLKWNGLLAYKKKKHWKKNIGVGRIREPVTVKTTTTKKDLKRLCSISSKLTASFMWLVFYCSRARMPTY